ncbi:hypothetical protein FQY83_08370 [Luteimonas marina]|uniref:Uncharacterized protein n=1 Tax=Luteimonas marina TaxID=488485 RepID=A0A5C5U678_9GAMM|nr:hypothetical protein FQY83_08370 [Luteimonas marina]
MKFVLFSQTPSCRHPRESGDPASLRKPMDPRLRGDDGGIVAPSPGTKRRIGAGECPLSRSDRVTRPCAAAARCDGCVDCARNPAGSSPR